MTDFSETGLGLNILVCIKFTVDSNLLQTDEATGMPDFKHATYRISAFDENAIEAALQLANHPSRKVVAVSLLKTPPPKEVMLKVLAMGIDALYIIKDDEELANDAFSIASVLVAAVNTIRDQENIKSWDLVVCGEASDDDYNSQVGPRLGTDLGLPIITYATQLSLEGNCLTAKRAIEERVETVETDLPALVTVGLEINDPRMPTVLQIMGAGRKPIVELCVSKLEGYDSFSLNTKNSIRDLEIFSPPSLRKQNVIEGENSEEIVEELLRQLGSEGEV